MTCVFSGTMGAGAVYELVALAAALPVGTGAVCELVSEKPAGGGGAVHTTVSARPSCETGSHGFVSKDASGCSERGVGEFTAITGGSSTGFD